MVRRAQANGDVYQGVYSGWFCTGCNEFKTDQQLVNGRCPDHPSLSLCGWKRTTISRSLLGQERLEGCARRTHVLPEHFRNEVLGWLKTLRDFASADRAPRASCSGRPWHRIYVCSTH
jgi:methionyl-tRNA synthetase